MDYHDLKRVVLPIVDSLDHKHLGAWLPSKDASHPDAAFKQMWFSWLADTCKDNDFYASSENLVWWIAERLNLLNRFKVRPQPGVTEFVESNRRDGGLTLPGIQLISMVRHWSKVQLSETCTSSCLLTYDEFRREINNR